MEAFRSAWRPCGASAAATKKQGIGDLKDLRDLKDLKDLKVPKYLILH